MTPDRVAEALAALESLEKGATPGEWRVGITGSGPGWGVVTDDDVICDVVSDKQDADVLFIARWRNAAPALLKLARDHIEHEHSVPLSWCDSCSALAELAEAVLGPEPGQ